MTLVTEDGIVLNPATEVNNSKMFASDFDPQIRALVHFLRAEGTKISYEEVEEETYTDDTYVADGATYLVVNDSDADDLWEQELDRYLEDCIYPELPDSAKNYFDDDAWKSDAKMDGRGHSLSPYDGCEYDAEADDETYYIYRTN